MLWERKTGEKHLVCTLQLPHANGPSVKAPNSLTMEEPLPLVCSRVSRYEAQSLRERHRCWESLNPARNLRARFFDYSSWPAPKHLT